MNPHVFDSLMSEAYLDESSGGIHHVPSPPSLGGGISMSGVPEEPEWFKEMAALDTPQARPPGRGFTPGSGGWIRNEDMDAYMAHVDANRGGKRQWNPGSVQGIVGAQPYGDEDEKWYRTSDGGWGRQMGGEIGGTGRRSSVPPPISGPTLYDLHKDIRSTPLQSMPMPAHMAELKEDLMLLRQGNSHSTLGRSPRWSVPTLCSRRAMMMLVSPSPRLRHLHLLHQPLPLPLLVVVRHLPCTSPPIVSQLPQKTVVASPL